MTIISLSAIKFELGRFSDWMTARKLGVITFYISEKFNVQSTYMWYGQGDKSEKQRPFYLAKPLEDKERVRAEVFISCFSYYHFYLIYPTSVWMEA